MMYSIFNVQTMKHEQLENLPDRISIHTGTARFDMRVNELGNLEIYAISENRISFTDQILIKSRASNVLELFLEER